MKVYSVPLFLAILWMLASICVPAHSAGDDQTPRAAAAQQFQGLSPLDVQTRMQRAQVHVFDANPIDIYNKNHVPGAKWVGYEKLAAQDLPSDKSAAIVFYCMNTMCRASHMAAERARLLGWTNIYLMPTGIQGWMDAGLPTESGRLASESP